VTATAARDVVLLGIGHTNAHVLRMWRMEPLKRARLTCVSDEAVATYSGMLPGVLAGQYPPERMEIDLVRLTAAAGADLIVDKVTGLDPVRQELLFDTRAPVRFDVLSVGIGSVPSWGGVHVANGDRIVTIKPMQTLLSRLEDRLRAAATERGREAIRTLVVGGGAGGVEVTLCLPPYLRRVLGANVRFDLRLITADEQILSGGLPRTTRRVERLLAARGVLTRTQATVVQISNRTVTLADGTVLEADIILWATGAAAPAVLARFNLPTDARGFPLTDATLRTTAGAPVFAVGDTGTIAGAPTPKAGVYAVRQGPVLWTNIERTLSGEPLRRYAPQRGFLKLLNTGDGRAIAEWRGATFEGAWCWRLKDFIDRRFIQKYQDYTRTVTAEHPGPP
jgi:selenide, water dikinase